MKIHEFVKMLKQYPADAEVMIQGFEKDSCNDYEAWYSEVYIIEHDKENNEVYIKGNLDA